MGGFSFACNEITLVLFTTLAPAGAVAYLIMGLPMLAGRVRGDAARRLNQCTCVPLVVAMVGLIASATHLGNPSNALYVFAGVGRSPLSTEVICAVAFLALAGVYWLYSFAERPRRGLQRAMLAAIDVAIVAFVIGVAFAYHVDTIPTWSLPLVPASLGLNALMGGPVLALASFAAAGFAPGKRGGRVLLGLATAAWAANLVVYGVLGFQLQGIGNELVSAADLAGSYPAFLGAFALLSAAGIVVAWRTERRYAAGPTAADSAVGVAAGRALDGGAEPAAAAAEPAADLAVNPQPIATVRTTASLPGLVVASLLVFAALFVMRFTFYMTHLTLGLGV
ncbi:DmsC/YnfH family molybdoenzyme membrane anchor subunit [Eggerthellaceae bacterium 24-137]